MIFKGRFRTVRHKDHAVPTPLPRPLLGPSSLLDIRAWAWRAPDRPLLLVSAPRKAGTAVARNRFRRRVRMAFLARAQALQGRPWVVWVRPGRAAQTVDTIAFRDIENLLDHALGRLPALDTP